MTGTVYMPSVGDLPDVLPIFPLTGVLLLPHGRLPLNIFEPRYLNMTNDALGGDRLIGMVQPRTPEACPVGETVEVYDTGCAGRITAFTETNDGRLLITLTGIIRFAIADEIEGTGGYRRIRADYDKFLSDLEPDPGQVCERSRLCKAMSGYFDHKNIEADMAAIEETPDQALVNTLSMVCPFDPREKQALLECPTLAERGELLASLMEMAVQEGDDSSGAVRH